MLKTASAAVIIAGTLVAIIIVIPLDKHRDAQSTPQVLGETNETIVSPFYYPEQFSRALAKASTLNEMFPSEQVAAGIIPHDITHGEYIAHFFSQLSAQQPANILLIGPNHYERGSTSLITSTADWQTPFGILASEKNTVGQLLAYQVFSEQNDVIREEHSIAGIVPYIAYYLPETEIIPIIFKAEVSLYEIEQLVSLLDKILSDNTIVVAAVDFSHYLTSDEAQRNDLITATTLRELDYQKILSFGPRFNDYVDSPPSIAFLLKWASEHNHMHSTILYNTNSALLAGQPNQPTTSYFEIVYY